MNKSLSDVLAYKNVDIVDRFLVMYNMEQEEAEKIFNETLKWLWLGNKMDGVFIDDSTLIIDEMWHNFILFTQDYEIFCLQNFGRYIHHQPEKRKQQNWYNNSFNIEEHKDRLEKLYEGVYDNLGEETLLTWYEEFPKKYSIENIKKMRR
ncbi:hypothetical protein Q73A0000_07040 [Kaistella flava (ex Peng et al. 2021)]|uniref:Uncharacterized protein n=1 Tax=Kaistella flava (ex Peng et al. 2021) TaxID=2038776 RepID=A0A7M2Y9P3_9FLAO|nr:hypothetical protein [Kaistella flava (ex Peng et al. 2021)]QOW10132.1 hypothetical protein Q73A0000_07040 [Kaistella flava (ex Peng et al. 2021)]